MRFLLLLSVCGGGAQNDAAGSRGTATAHVCALAAQGTDFVQERDKLIAAGEVEQALALLADGQHREPLCGQHLNDVGVLRTQLGDVSEALVSFSTAVQMDPGSDLFADNLAATVNRSSTDAAHADDATLALGLALAARPRDCTLAGSLQRMLSLCVHLGAACANGVERAEAAQTLERLALRSICPALQQDVAAPAAAPAVASGTDSGGGTAQCEGASCAEPQPSAGNANAPHELGVELAAGAGQQEVALREAAACQAPQASSCVPNPASNAKRDAALAAGDTHGALQLTLDAAAADPCCARHRNDEGTLRGMMMLALLRTDAADGAGTAKRQALGALQAFGRAIVAAPANDLYVSNLRKFVETQLSTAPALYMQLLDAIIATSTVAVEARPQDCTTVYFLKEKLYKRSEVLLAARDYDALRHCYADVQALRCLKPAKEGQPGAGAATPTDDMLPADENGQHLTNVVEVHCSHPSRQLQLDRLAAMSQMAAARAAAGTPAKTAATAGAAVTAASLEIELQRVSASGAAGVRRCPVLEPKQLEGAEGRAKFRDHLMQGEGQPFVVRGGAAAWASSEAWRPHTMAAPGTSGGRRVLQAAVSPSVEFDGHEPMSWWEFGDMPDDSPWPAPGPNDPVFVRPANICCRLEDFQSLLSANAKTNVTYYAEYADLADTLPETLDLVQEPVWARGLSEELAAGSSNDGQPPPMALKMLNFWLGDGRARAKIHFDRLENVLAQVSGSKTFVMYPPSDDVHLYYNQSLMPSVQMKFEFPDKWIRKVESPAQPWGHDFSPVNILRPDPLHPAVAKATPTICEVAPGDLLFVPSFWWHEVYSSPDVDDGWNLAVNWWYHPARPLPIGRTPIPGVGVKSTKFN